MKQESILNNFKRY